MSTPQWDTADILCVLASCGRQHTGEHHSSAVARRIVWTQARGALVREGGRGGELHSVTTASQTYKSSTQACVWGDGCEHKSYVCVRAMQKRKGGKRKEVAACVRVSLCLRVYVEGVLVYLAGSLAEGGFCKEEVCYSQNSCWYLAYEEYPRTEKREETEKDKTE